MTQEHRINLDKVIELYKSKVAFYESQNTRGEYAVTVRELKYVVETLEALRSEISQGDLISREALKGAFKIEELYWGKRIIDIIDNATTVEPEPISEIQKKALKVVQNLTKENSINFNERRFLREAILSESKRPQGEWGPCYENYKNGLFYRDCSICGKATMTGDWKFCPYCGAAMRDGIPTTDDKGAEE